MARSQVLSVGIPESSARTEAFSHVKASYFEWTDDLPHIHDVGSGRGRCYALRELDSVHRELRFLTHLLMRIGEAALGNRLDMAFKRVIQATKEINRFLRSEKFQDIQWLDGDIEGQQELSIAPADVADEDLLERALSIAKEERANGRGLHQSLCHAGFWLAHNIARRGGEPAEARRKVWELTALMRASAGSKPKVVRYAIWRAFGRLALGWEYIAPRIGLRRLAPIEEFWRELQLGESPVTTSDALSASPGHATPVNAIALPSFPTPAGAAWKDVSMRFVNGHTLKITIGNLSERASFKEMGFADRRRDVPNMQWELLRQFSQNHGVIDWDTRTADPKHRKRKQDLSACLQTFFGIAGDPFVIEGNGWKSRFRIDDDA